MWLAEVYNGALLRVENGRTRDQVIDHLRDLAAEDANLVVGLDFAFSTPAWYLHQLGVDAPGLWKLADTKAEEWLAECAPPFWGRPKTKRPELPEHFRVADRLAVGGISQSQVFQIEGAGAVGTGSIRGWPFLRRLQSCGFAVWPFDPVNLPMVLEIYPRSLTGPVVKSSAAARVDYVSAHFPQLTSQQKELVASSEHAFDAAVSALVMHQHADEFIKLTRADDPVAMLEGLIWAPASVAKIQALGAPPTVDEQFATPRRSPSFPRRLAGRLGSMLTRFAEPP
jgi:hypothetical protein